jgi:hypothetical protein
MPVDNAPAERNAVTIEIDLDQLIAAACSLPPDARRRLRDALDALSDERGEWLDAALTSEGNPLLAELWDNEHDAAYDSL